MATSNVIVVRSGTGFTIDVTAVNLLADLTIKDFVIKHDGVIVCNLSSCPSYTKTNRTTLTYNGISLPSTSIEVQRKTPNTPYRTYSYLERILPGDLSSELDRGIRWREEADLNGVGTASLVSVALPKDDAYGVIWDADTIYPPTRNALYDKIQTLAPLSSPTLVTPTLTNPTSSDGTFDEPTINSAAINNSALNAACTATTQASSTVGNQPATGQWVNDWYYNQRSIGMVSQTRSIAHSTFTSIHGAWTPQYLKGSLTVLNDGGNFLRVGVGNSGWYRMTVRLQEGSAKSDYFYLRVSAGLWNGATYTIARELYQGNPGTVTSPTFTVTGTFFVSFGAGVDTIISCLFQQNNTAGTAGSWVFEMEVEKLFV